MTTPITPRQTEVLSHLAHGDTIDQTAHALGVSTSTVEKTLAAGRKRLNGRNVTHAVYIAAKAGLIAITVMISMSDNDEMARRTARLRTGVIRVVTARRNREDV